MNLEDKIQELSQAIDNLEQELNAPKVGDWYMVLDAFEEEDLLGKSTYVPGDIFKVHNIDKSDMLASKIWLYNKSINPIGLGGCRKLSESEVLKHLADKAGIKIGDTYKSRTYRYTDWRAGVWKYDFSTPCIAQGFCFEEGFPCVYCIYNGFRVVTRLEELVKIIILIGTSRHKVRISNSGIYNEYSDKTTVQELKNLITPFEEFSTGHFTVNINTVDIGCVKGVTIEEIKNIIQEAEKMGLS